MLLCSCFAAVFFCQLHKLLIRHGSEGHGLFRCAFDVRCFHLRLLHTHLETCHTQLWDDGLPCSMRLPAQSHSQTLPFAYRRLFKFTARWQEQSTNLAARHPAPFFGNHQHQSVPGSNVVAWPTVGHRIHWDLVCVCVALVGSKRILPRTFLSLKSSLPDTGLRTGYSSSECSSMSEAKVSILSWYG